MKPTARTYIALTLALGACALAGGAGAWRSVDGLMFLVYFGAALLTSRWKVTLPGVRGTLSANFLFVLLCMVEMGSGQTIAIAVGSVLFQYVHKARSRLTWVQALFNVANIAVAADLACLVYNSRVIHAAGIEFPLRLELAAIVYFFANTLPVSIIIALTESKGILETWRKCYIWSFPHYLVGSAIAGALHLMNREFGWQSSLLVVPVVFLVFRSFGLYLSKLESERERAETQRLHAEETASLHLRTIEALALAIEANDQNTHSHLRRVEVYCVEMGRLLGFNEQELQGLQAASLLHDIGKLAVPEHILSKPGKLTPEEFEKIKIHPVVGAEILERVRFPYGVAPIVRHHHERWDGSGYPDGLSGEQIPVGARILGAIDCLDALASERHYHRAVSLDEAMNAVEAEAGKSYDPQVVRLLRENYVEMEKKARLAECTGLSVRDCRVDRAAEPAAGFESAPESCPQPSLAASAESRPESGPESGLDVHAAPGFLFRIGAARQEVRLLFEVSQEMAGSLRLSDMMGQLGARLRSLVAYDAIAVYMVRDEHLEAAHVEGEDKSLFDSLKIPCGQGLSGWVVQNRMSILNGNPAVEPGYLSDPGVFTIHRSALAVPIEGSSGVLGALTLYSRQSKAFSREDLRVMLAISSKLGVAVENSIRYQEAEENAGTDFLTGLPNARTLFASLSDELAHARATRQPVVVLLADLDGFKKVNDTFGHLTGNQVLKALAQTLREQCRTADTVARMGGDEFVIICPGLPAAMVRDVVVRLTCAIEKTGLAVLGRPVLSASIGSAVFPYDGEQTDELLAEADRTMYEAKQSSGQRFAALVNLADAAGHPDSPLAAGARTDKDGGRCEHSRAS